MGLYRPDFERDLPRAHDANCIWADTCTDLDADCSHFSIVREAMEKSFSTNDDETIAKRLKR